MNKKTQNSVRAAQSFECDANISNIYNISEIPTLRDVVKRVPLCCRVGDVDK